MNHHDYYMSLQEAGEQLTELYERDAARINAVFKQFRAGLEVLESIAKDYTASNIMDDVLEPDDPSIEMSDLEFTRRANDFDAVIDLHDSWGHIQRAADDIIHQLRNIDLNPFPEQP